MPSKTCLFYLLDVYKETGSEHAKDGGPLCLLSSLASVFLRLKMLSCLVSLWLLLSGAAGKARLLHVIGICAQWTQVPLLLILL